MDGLQPLVIAKLFSLLSLESEKEKKKKWLATWQSTDVTITRSPAHTVDNML
jgi:hypothetical protein